MEEWSFQYTMIITRKWLVVLEEQQPKTIMQNGLTARAFMLGTIYTIIGLLKNISKARGWPCLLKDREMFGDYMRQEF